MRVERTMDLALIRAVFLHPEIKRTMWGDIENPPFPIVDSVYYVVARADDGEVIGLMWFLPVNSVTWNPHLGVREKYRGNGTGTAMLKLGIEWMFKNTPCLKLVVHPPESHGITRRLWEKCGFKYEGKSPKSAFFDGKLQDRLLLGLEKE